MGNAVTIILGIIFIGICVFLFFTSPRRKKNKQEIKENGSENEADTIKNEKRHFSFKDKFFKTNQPPKDEEETIHTDDKPTIQKDDTDNKDII